MAESETEKAFSSNPFKGKETVKRLKNVARNVPILGTAFDVADIASSVATGNLGQAAVDTGLALAGTTPVGRGITKLGKFAYNVFKKADDKDIALKMIKDKDARENWVKEKQKELGIDPNDPTYGDTDLVPKAEIKRRQTRKFDEQVEQLEKDEITGTEYRRFIRENQPATTFNKEDLDTMIPTFEDLVGGLDVRNANKASSGVIGLDSTIEKGAEVTARLDIPAYNLRDIWVATLKKIKGTAEDKKSKYGRTAVLKDVEFYIEGKSPKKITNVMGIGKGKRPKTPFATMKGKWQDVSDEDAFEMAKKAMDDPSYIQVGFNPERHSFFYDKATMLPVFEATNIIQIGPLVLAKVPGVTNSALAAKTLSKPERVKRIGKLRGLRVDTSGKGEFPGRPRTFNKGGTTVQNQMKMAFMQDGGLQDEGGTVDKESGNDVPSGSLKKEVRDDVPAMLSEGEFVIPADVVRYIGLEKLMQMRQQAKMGLQMMEKMGQMGNSEEAEIPDDLPFGVTDIVVMGSDDDDDEKEMAQGGVIYAQEGTDVSSSRSIPNWVNPPSGDGPVTMAQVKLTNPVTGETFTANTGGYSVKSVDEIKRMMGEENTDVSAPFMNNPPISSNPPREPKEGFEWFATRSGWIERPINTNQGPTNQQANAIGSAIGQLAGFGGSTGTQVNSGFMPHMYFYNTDTKQYRILPAGMLGRMSGDTEITQEEYKKAIGDELANERIQEANKVYENMPQPKPEKDYTQSKEPVTQRENRIDEGYYIDRPLPPQQPQQTQFEQMMGYSAGQGSNPYARKGPFIYENDKGETAMVYHDYMNRPMDVPIGYKIREDQGEDTPAPSPDLTPDDGDSATDRRQAERKDDRKKTREAERKASRDAQIDKDIKNLQDSGDPRFVGKTGKEARDAYFDLSFKERASMAKEDLAGRPAKLKEDLDNLLEKLPDAVKNIPTVINAIGDVYKDAGIELGRRAKVALGLQGEGAVERSSPPPSRPAGLGGEIDDASSLEDLQTTAQPNPFEGSTYDDISPPKPMAFGQTPVGSLPSAQFGQTPVGSLPSGPPLPDELSYTQGMQRPSVPSVQPNTTEPAFTEIKSDLPNLSQGDNTQGASRLIEGTNRKAMSDRQKRDMVRRVNSAARENDAEKKRKRNISKVDKKDRDRFRKRREEAEKKESKESKEKNKKEAANVRDYGISGLKKGGLMKKDYP